MTYGAGTISPDRDRFRLRMPNGRGGYRNAGSFATYEEAERARDALNVERDGFPAGAESLHAYGLRVIARWARAGMRSHGDALSRWNAIVARAPFAALPPAAVERADVRDWLRALPQQDSARGTPLSWQSCKHARTLVCRVFDEALEDGLITVNPARGVKMPRKLERVEGWTWLTVAELEAVFALDLTLEQRTAITLAVYQGLRQGELAALTWECVDLEGGWLLIASSWSGATKSGRTRRIPLLRPARDALLRWRPKKRTRVGLVISSVAGGVHGGGMYARGYDWQWGDRRNERADLPTQAGVARRVRWHDLRHTCAAHLISGSWGQLWELHEVCEFLGHSSITVTERYAHLDPRRLAATAAATANEPAANLPRDVSSAAAQVLEFIRQAMRDSNARPSAPEADALSS